MSNEVEESETGLFSRLIKAREDVFFFRYMAQYVWNVYVEPAKKVNEQFGNKEEWELKFPEKYRKVLPVLQKIAAQNGLRIYESEDYGHRGEITVAPLEN